MVHLKNQNGRSLHCCRSWMCISNSESKLVLMLRVCDRHDGCCYQLTHYVTLQAQRECFSSERCWRRQKRWYLYSRYVLHRRKTKFSHVRVLSEENETGHGSRIREWTQVIRRKQLRIRWWQIFFTQSSSMDEDIISSSKYDVSDWNTAKLDAKTIPDWFFFRFFSIPLWVSW